ncbi:MAG TPA: agmatine deiminase family protein [Flavisolibacter sp.]|nr:agmatine deiminase family protein [Flavisolibacter sp.]
MKYIILLVLAATGLRCAVSSKPQTGFFIPGEFEQQEYIWLSWKETGFLGGAPFKTAILDAIEVIHPEVKVKLLYGPELNFDKGEIEQRIWQSLLARKIDTGRIELFYNEKAFGAIQDPGPIFLKSSDRKLAVADFRYQHPDKRSEAIDKNVARNMNLPLVSSEMFSEGGAWQTNGKGTMLLVESVELDRNRSMTKEQIEKEYERVLGVKKFIWFKAGLKEEEFGLLEDGRYGIGTGGHIDEFCRFVDAETVLLTAIPPEDTVDNPILKSSFKRMEENLAVLQKSSLQDGRPFKIIRIPAGPLMTKKLLYSSLNSEEKSWFENVRSDSVEFYLTTGYMNFIIANNIVVSAKFWKEGLPASIKELDEEAYLVLSKAFPGRRIVQIDCMPLHHDGAGLHCHSRNEPMSK